MKARHGFVVGVVVVSLIAAAMTSAGLAASPQKNATPSAAQSQPALPSGVSSDWWGTVQKNIAAEEYHVTWQKKTALQDVGAAWQAPNRAQNFRTYFTDNGPRVVRRMEENDSWIWGLELIGVNGAKPPAVEKTDVKNDRIEQRRGPLVEWYVNNTKGLEQGFTILEQPKDFGGKIVLDVAVRGDLRPRMLSDGKTVEFQSEGGVALIHYGQLSAKDAKGRELPSRMEIVSPSASDSPRSAIGKKSVVTRQSSIRIVVSAAGAQFPVVIDPLATSAAWTAESDQTSSDYAWSLGPAGDVNGDGYSDIVVGANRYDTSLVDAGRAYLYLGSASGPSPSAAWIGEGDQAGCLFGHTVSTAGDVNGDGYSDVIISAVLYDGTVTDAGRVYVYHGGPSGLSTTPAWTVESDQTGCWFGYSVSTAGDVNGDGYSDVIVGAHLYDNGEANEGRAYVYHGSMSGLSATDNWTTESNQASAMFGRSVSTAGDVNGDGYSDVIVGAIYYDNGETNEGRAYVYHGSASGLSATPNWTAESDQAAASFGRSVSTAGDVNGDGYSDVIVGAHLYDNGEANEGRAYVYHGSASGLSATLNWTAESDQASAYFGARVATAGDVNGDGYSDVIVGADCYDNDQTDEGRAYVYHGSASGLSATANWTAESDQASAYFGARVATAGDVNGDGYSDVIVGASGYDNDQTDEGRAYVYLGSASGLASSAAWTGESGQDNAYFGAAVSSAGDVNGDGYCDVVVGAYSYDGGQTDEGRAWVYHGSASGLSSSPDWTAESDQANARFGYSVSRAGDVNGDGYCDVIIGAPGFGNGQSSEGRAFVFHGSSTGLTTGTANWTAESDQAGANFGNAVATAGDVNGDGYGDVIIGAHNYDGGQDDEGRAYVYHGSASGLGTTATWTVESNQAYANFGNSVGSAGDVNGDGYSDVIVGAYNYDGGQEDEGRATVYHGSASGLSTSANWTAESNQTYAYFGRSVATAGDVNGDGFSDVIVGASGYSNGQSGEGGVFVYHGSASGLSSTANWTMESNQASAWFGASVAGAGDVNGDGYSDVIVGAERFDNGQEDEGRAWVYLGSASGLNSTADWTAESNQAFAYFGGCVAAAGDVNGDGYGDVIVGARAYDSGQNDEGGAFVYYGGGGGGMSLKARQLRVNSDAPIVPPECSDSADGLRLAMLGRTPFGRGKVKLECEVKPLGTAFNGTSTTITGSWQDTTTGGVSLIASITGLGSSTSTLYHWRARLLYNQAALPFMQKSRWLMTGSNGALESDFRLPALSPTAAGVMDFRARTVGNEVVLEWTTAQEADTLGFLVYRETGGKRTCLTPKMVMGRAWRGDAAASVAGGGKYSWKAEAAKSSVKDVRYWLEEITLDGKRILHGPVAPAR